MKVASPGSRGAEVRLSAGLLAERYRYAPGPAEGLPPHVHDAYQIGIGWGVPGGYFYRYRGARHAVGPGALTVVHPGEAHSTGDLADRPVPCVFATMYVDPDLVHRAAGPKEGRDAPFLSGTSGGPVVADRGLSGLFSRAHAAFLEEGVPTFEVESLVLALLMGLLHRAGERPTAPVGPRTGRERDAVGTARSYLRDNLSKNVSLGELSRLVDLHPSYLARAFRRAVGLPPHRYQSRVRVERAKELLAEGVPAERVAVEVGFYDQSHLWRHFRAVVGVTPGRYSPPDHG